MNDEREALAAAVAAVTAPKSLRVLHKAIIVDQDGGDIGVKMPDDNAPSATAKPVPIWFGLPGFSAVFKPSAAPETSIGFHGGDESKAFSALYPYFPGGRVELPIVSLSFGGGTKPIARVDDTVSCGSIRLTNTPPAPGPTPTGFTIERIDANGAVTILGAVVGPVAVAPSPLTIPLNGKITTGRTEFRA